MKAALPSKLGAVRGENGGRPLTTENSGRPTAVASCGFVNIENASAGTLAFFVWGLGGDAGRPALPRSDRGFVIISSGRNRVEPLY
jgi:hypothetical protein